MSKAVFFSFKEEDRRNVLTVKGRAVNPFHDNLNFDVQEIVKRSEIECEEKAKQLIADAVEKASRTIVFVGKKTHKSDWVPHEVQTSLEMEKPVYAIYVEGKEGSKIPKCLSDNNIYVYRWSEARMQQLATL